MRDTDSIDELAAKNHKILINIDIYNCLCYIVLVVINENLKSILIGGN